MADLTSLPGPVLVKNGLTVQENFFPPAGFLNDDHVSTNALKRIAANKLIHQPKQVLAIFDLATAVSAKTLGLGAVYGVDGALLDFSAWIDVVADDASRVATVDLKRSTAGGAFASVLSAPISITTSTAVRVPQHASISVDDLLEDDLLQVVVAVSGSGGTTHAKGLTVQAVVTEAPV